MAFSTLIYPLATDILTQLENIRRYVVYDRISSFINIATALAAILCAFSLLKVSNDYLEGRGVTMYQVLRPLLIFVVCADFTLFVANPLHAVVTVFTKQMRESVNVTEKQYIDALSEHLLQAVKTCPQFIVDSALDESAKVAENNDKVQAYLDDVVQSHTSEGSWLRKASELVEGIIMSVVSMSTGVRELYSSYRGGAKGVLKLAVYLTLVELLQPILFFLAKFFYLANQVMCYFYLMVYMLIGPFVFAIGILEPFKNGIVMWIARYVQTCFWIPVGQLVMWINYKILVMMGDAMSGFSGGADFVNVAILIVSIFNILSIPSLANTIIESSGTGGAEDRVGGALKTAGSMFLRSLA